MHDCNPPNKASSFPSNSPEEASLQNLNGWNGDWCGDVWKTICFLRSNRKDLNIFVLDCDYGLGIIQKGIPDGYLYFSDKKIEEMDYEEFSNNRKEFLNLKDEKFMFEFLERI